jgi:hypothetical protein
VEPDPAAAAAYAELFPLFRKFYFTFGQGGSMGTLRRVAAQVRGA